jgi:ABC-type nitrate/sulfonate/bicarbonate transport system permease component
MQVEQVESKAEAFFGVLLACAIGISLGLLVAYNI